MDEDLGLDDVELFSEYIQFKQKKIKLNRAKAAAQAAAASKVAVELDPFLITSTTPNAPSPPQSRQVTLPNSTDNGAMPQNTGGDWLPVPAVPTIITTPLPTFEPEAQPVAVAAPDIDLSSLRREHEHDSRRRDSSRERRRFSRERDRSRERRRSRQRSRSRSPRRKRRSPPRSSHLSRHDDRHDGHQERHDGPSRRSPIQPIAVSEWDGGMMGPATWQTTRASPPYVPPETIEMKLAIRKEAEQQKETFAQQREGCLRKRETLISEWTKLKSQKHELMGLRTSEAQKIIAENQKFQDELSVKVKAVDNVLDMLTGLVGDDMPLPRDRALSPPRRRKSRSRSRSSSAGRSRTRKKERERSAEKDRRRTTSESSLSVKPKPEESWNYIYFDPGDHWCRPCRFFPPTAKEYLTHLHSPEHRLIIQERKLTELPWHVGCDHQERPVNDGWLSKRVPIKGLQFFVAAPAWFCKLCRIWMGDLHCASLHLKSAQHSQLYAEFEERNPTWENTWLSERAKGLQEKAQQEAMAVQRLKLEKQLDAEMKKHIAAAELLIPLSLGTQPVRRRSKKKTTKKSKKKKRYSSDSSSDSSSSSSSGDRRRKKQSKPAKVPVLKASLPEKSKWEKNSKWDVDDNTKWGREDREAEKKASRAKTPDQNIPLLEVKEVVKNYRISSERSKTHGKSQTTYKSPYEPKLPDKHSISIPDSPPPSRRSYDELPLPTSSSRRKPKYAEELPDEPESKFDKQAIAAAKKKPAPTPKTKFSFIGRMPFAKRGRQETGQEDSGGKKEQDVATPDPTPPPPPFISKQAPRSVAPAAPVLTSKTKLEIAKEILNRSHNTLQALRHESQPVDPVVLEQELGIEKPRRSPPSMRRPSPPKIAQPKLPPEVTQNLGRPTMVIPLPKDFQEALSIIYPEEKTADPEPPPPPSLQPPLPKNPPPPTYNFPSLPQVSDAIDMFLPVEPRPPTPPPPPLPKASFDMFRDDIFSLGGPDDDDMALLGMDKEDMAAQKF